MDIINKIVWQSANGDKSWVYALCPTQGVNMVSFQVQTGWQATDGLPRTTTPAERAEVARRLVACWNACTGTDTEVLERLPPLTELIKQDKGRSHKAEIERDQLKEAALAARRTAKLVTDKSGHELIAVEPQLWRAIQAACQPAPPVVPQPGDDTEGGAR